MCLVAFQKIFQKIFSGVWKRKKENTNPEKHKPQPRSRRPTTAPSIAIQDRDHDLAFFARSRLTARSREAPRHRTQSIAISPLIELANRASIVDDFFFLGFVRVFLGLSVPSSFPNTRKYFLEIFLKCNQTHENIFLSGNAFTRTKHSLK